MQARRHRGELVFFSCHLLRHFRQAAFCDKTLPTYVTSTCLPLSLRITNRTLTLHSGRLHSAPPLKNTAEWILREFSDLTWLFLKRKLHHGLLSLTLLRKIRVQSPLSNRPTTWESVDGNSFPLFIRQLKPRCGTVNIHAEIFLAFSILVIVGWIGIILR